MIVSPPLILHCNAILFDLDGVLVDSRACVEATWRRWALSHDFDPTAVLRVAHGRRSIDTIRHIAPALDADAEVATLAASESATTDGVYEVPGARELLARLPVRNWAIVTSGVRSIATLRITHTKLPVPRVLVCADEISRGKPDPEGYLTAAHRLGVAPETCIVVEDAPAGLEAAHAAGMQSIGISSTFPRSALDAATVCGDSLAELEVTIRSGVLPITLRVVAAA